MTVYLERKRTDVADLAGKLQHVIGGFPLLLLGIGKLREGEEIPMALIEVAVAAVVLFTFAMDVYAVRRRRAHPEAHHEHPAVGWFDLAAGVLLIFEAFHGERHKSGFLRPQFFSGVVTLALGAFHASFHGFRKRRRYLTIDDSGVSCRLGPFQGFRIARADLESIEVERDRAVFRHKNGRIHTLDLAGLHNSAAVREAIRETPLLPPV